MDVCPDSDLVSLQRADRDKRAGMARPADGAGGTVVPPAGELPRGDSGLSTSTSPAGPAVENRLGEVVRRIGRATESDPRDVIRAVCRELLLDLSPERMGD